MAFWQNTPSTISPINATNLNNLAGGWTKISETLTLTIDDFNSFVVSTSVSTLDYLSVGMKLRLKQGGSYKYFIITAINSTTLTLYGGTDYQITGVPITDVYFSVHRTPFGFPTNPDKWSVIVNDTTQRLQITVGTTVYNLGGINIVIPIGLFKVRYDVVAQIGDGGKAIADKYMTFGLSTTNNTIVADFSCSIAGSNTKFVKTSANKEFLVTAGTKVTLYMNAKDDAGAGETIYFLNGGAGQSIPLVIKAVCAYL